jgi:hypothetical protein
MANTENRASRHYVSFIEVLYAVVVGETIFTYSEEFFSSPTTLSTFALFVTYCSIISSFIFWHGAIVEYPHKNSSRFFVDITVLIFYLHIIFNHSNIDALLVGFIGLYFLYLFWDFLTRIEHGRKASRLITSTINLCIVGIIYVVRELLVCLQISSLATDLFALVTLFLFIIISQVLDILRIYHRNKSHATLSD